MNDSQLNELLKSAKVPERPASYWERFPRRVLARIAECSEAKSLSSTDSSVHSRHALQVEDSRDLSWQSVGRAIEWLFSRPVLAVGLIAVCLLVGVALGFRFGRHSGPAAAQIALAQRYLGEIEALFPNQIEAIVFDDQGPRLILAEQADVPTSQPLYLSICGPRGCQKFVTFSGRQIHFNGEVFEVLLNRQGDVLLIGEQMVWSSSDRSAKAGPFRIEARPLPTVS